MKAIVVGGAGFIGSHLTDALLEHAERVTIVDDLSVGRREFLTSALASGRAELISFRVSHEPADVDRLAGLLAGHDIVFHMAANPEARWGLNDTSLDLRQNTWTTWALLEAMRKTGVKRMVLASSGTVYGDIPRPLGEDHGPMLPISLYGASKLASEALVSAFVHCFGVQGYLFRFGNVIGGRGTHGVTVDLLRKLERTPQRLDVLGDGRQRKPYLHVSDCVAGILYGVQHATEPLNYFNLAPEGSTSVAQIVEMLLIELASTHRPEVVYSGGDRGWPGDVAISLLDPAKLATLGFRVRYSSDEAVRQGIRELVAEWRSTQRR